MTSSPEVVLSSLAAQAFSNGYAVHGEVDLQFEVFESYLYVAIEKHLGSNAPASTLLSFVRTLRTTDLYLALACAQPTESAWRRFINAYQKYINDVARFVSPTDEVARELADNLLSDLILPDGSGRSRIASFDGRQSLATWLRVVISRRAINYHLPKWSSFERSDHPAEVADKASLGRIEAALRNNRYAVILSESFKLASESLTDRERLMLLLRYEEGLRLVEIAKVLGVHASGITRQFQHIHLKLKKKIISVLAVKHHLGPEAIKECLLDVMENPAHSLLVFLKAS
ncbi:MAG: sigma-70 family RNA polymerase sigma factor [Acidobacteriota bacterium]